MDTNAADGRNEIEQFLYDVREHFKASLETSEYENTSNFFHVTEAETTARLLQRCEILLQQYTLTYNNKKPQDQQYHLEVINGNVGSKSGRICSPQAINEFIVSQKLNGSSHKPQEQEEEACYLDMSSTFNKSSSECMDFHSSTDSDKTFRCSVLLRDMNDGKLKHPESNESICENDDDRSTTADLDNDDDSFDEDTQIYDICQVSQVDIDFSLSKVNKDCPYMNLPAGHLAIQKSTKYGQLQRIEKRLFFDQSKKCYCGILNDWLLCYADGPTGSHPTTSIFLRCQGIEIEHSGEGKRREICFQITTGDPNKKLVFQANNEVDAKEWIHAIETAIRNDIKKPRKLPTPPVGKKITFVGSNSCSINGKNDLNNAVLGNKTENDYIYEEPSPVCGTHAPNELILGKPSELPKKLNSPVDSAQNYEYDVPKCPAQRIVNNKQNEVKQDASVGALNDLETDGLLNISNGQLRRKNCLTETMDKIDFQMKVKDLHSKLSSQLLSSGSSPAYAERFLKKPAKAIYSNSSTESETLASTTSPTAKDLKKQKKCNTSNASPPKLNNNPNANNTSNEKSAKNWFLNRLNKTTSIHSSTIATPASNKCRQSEKENLLNNLDPCENFDSSSKASSPILKTNGSNVTDPNCVNNKKSKVNLIINQFESSGGHFAMFSMEAMAGLSAALSDNDNYEPITTSTHSAALLKKV